MRYIQLTKQKQVIVDDEVFELVSKYSWCAVQPRDTTWYAVRQLRTGRVHMHRYIWENFKGEIPVGMFIDHINRDGLDNRLDNLRVVTTSENMINRGPARNNKLGERGIYKTLGGYKITLYKNRKKILDKWYKTEEEAKKARDSFVR